MIETSEILSKIKSDFDVCYPITKQLDFDYPLENFNYGLIIGSSGSGKSTILKQINQSQLGHYNQYQWDSNLSVAEQFYSYDELKNKLLAVGFNTIPSWLKPFHQLSTGEQYRVNLAKNLSDGFLIDEFTSYLDRDTAKSCCIGLDRYINEKGLHNIVIASSHTDIIEWLQPHWIFDCDKNQFIDRGLVRQRSSTILQIYSTDTSLWNYFKPYHYLSGDLNKSAKCWVAFINNKLAGFIAILPMPSGTIKNAYRGHRTVILPQYQGIGIGSKLSEAIGDIMRLKGYRYYSKTSHPIMGNYRNRSPKWKATSKNQKPRKDYLREANKKRSSNWKPFVEKRCYSHEYIGENK